VRHWLDTEFIEDGKTIDLISIGIVAEDGRELYLQNLDCNFAAASDWVVRNVLINLQHYDMGTGRRSCRTSRDGLNQVHCVEHKPCVWIDRRGIATAVMQFCDSDKYGKPDFYGYYADYDWVVFCQLFGRMVDLPKGFPMYCRDIKQWADQMGNPKLPEQGKSEHHALSDALWNRQAWEFLRDKEAEVKS
jgi:hypothetical protein